MQSTHSRCLFSRTPHGIELRITLPNDLINRHRSPTGQAQPNPVHILNTPPQLPHPNQPSTLAQRKSKAQQLLEMKRSQTPELPPSGQPISNPPQRNETINHVLVETEPRERTRDNQQRARSPQQTRPSDARQQQERKKKPFEQPMKMRFQPRFNQSDGIYAIYKQCYSLRGSTHPGFMIVNYYPCQPESAACVQFEASMPRPLEDDCGIGITFKPQDPLKQKGSSHLRRCMAYYLSSQRLRVGEATYPISLPQTRRPPFRLIANLKKKLLMLVDSSNDILSKKVIPEEFLQQRLFMFLELKNGGRIKIIE